MTCFCTSFFIYWTGILTKRMRCGMIRVILILLVLIVFLLVSALPLLIGEKCVWKNDENRQKEYALQVVKQVLRMLFRLTGSTLTVKGLENIPDMPVLYVGNHRSYFDIVTGYIVVPGQTGFIAKKEMEKIPLLSTWMRFVYCLFLDRENPKEGLKTILQAIDYVKNGISICIFPEGTRNKGEELSLLPFKEGAFKIATKTGCPIVPISMNNTAEIFENHFPKIKKTHVVLEYGTPIYPNELDKDVKKHIGSYVENIVNETIHKNAELLKN